MSAAPGVSNLAEALARHALADIVWDAFAGHWVSECTCEKVLLEPSKLYPSNDEHDAGEAHRRHVAEVIAASGVVVPVAEVREVLAGLDEDVTDLRADIPPVGPPRVAHIFRTAGLSDAADRLRALLARLAGEGR